MISKEFVKDNDMFIDIFQKLFAQVLNKDGETNWDFRILHGSFSNRIEYTNKRPYWGLSKNSIHIHELAFLTRDYLKTKSKHLTLNQSIDDIFKEANNILDK